MISVIYCYLINCESQFVIHFYAGGNCSARSHGLYLRGRENLLSYASFIEDLLALPLNLYDRSSIIELGRTTVWYLSPWVMLTICFEYAIHQRHWFNLTMPLFFQKAPALFARKGANCGWPSIVVLLRLSLNIWMNIQFNVHFNICSNLPFIVRLFTPQRCVRFGFLDRLLFWFLMPPPKLFRSFETIFSLVISKATLIQCKLRASVWAHLTEKNFSYTVWSEIRRKMQKKASFQRLQSPSSLSSEKLVRRKSQRSDGYCDLWLRNDIIEKRKIAEWFCQSLFWIELSIGKPKCQAFFRERERPWNGWLNLTRSAKCIRSIPVNWL